MNPSARDLTRGPDMTSALHRPALLLAQKALRQRPHTRHFMEQRWHQLLFVHYACDPEEIQRLLPAGVDVDTFPDRDGVERAWLGVVLFEMREVGFPGLPWRLRFPEYNVRTYVRIGDREPSVWFFSLNAPKPLVSFVARRAFHLPYYPARLRRRVERDGDQLVFSDALDWRKRGVRLSALHRTREEYLPPEAGSLDFFLLERYQLLAQSPSGGLYRGRVWHHPYPVWLADLTHWETNILEWLGLASRQPAHYCWSPGVDALLWRPQALDVESIGEVRPSLL